MHADLVIYNIGKLLTSNKKAPIRGKDMNNISFYIDAFIAIKDGLIIDIGEGDYKEYLNDFTFMHNAQGNVVIPGLIDSHTHLVHYGSRENEFAQLRKGVPYLDILKQGGGIHSTVNATRQATKEELFEKAWKSLDIMLLHGVTSIEAKSGYGLNLETETKQLVVASELNEFHPITIVSTYLGAHTVSKEFTNNKALYIKSLVNDMTVIKEKGLATFIDVFCEDGVFTKEESEYILKQGKLIGLIPKIHADEVVSLGGVKIATKLKASSADHLMAISNEDIIELANSNVIANLLPSTSFYLNKEYAPAREMIAKGCALSISSDYNPGSSPSENLQFTMQLAANKLKMTAIEILNATTINAAYNLRISNQVGSIEKGKDADIVILDSKNLDYIMYHFGINHVLDVFKKGELVVIDKTLV